MRRVVCLDTIVHGVGEEILFVHGVGEEILFGLVGWLAGWLAGWAGWLGWLAGWAGFSWIFIDFDGFSRIWCHNARGPEGALRYDLLPL